MTTLAFVLLFFLALPVSLSCSYLLLMTLLSGRLKLPPASSRTLRFDVIIPAHNEVAIIERTIASLRRLSWPPDRFRVMVVADNCTDDTARVADAAGARALVRNDADRRGKGYALLYAFSASRAEGWADAVVVVDADTEVSPNLLEAFAARLETGVQAVQAHYGVLNPMASWRTRLITIAMGAFHVVRSRARERLGLTSGIRGNGWCVTHELLDEVPFRAFSLTEDVEYGITIGLAGHRVAFADEAHADADMVSSEVIARQQRQRWEDGRFQLMRSKTLELLVAAVRRRSAMCLDLGLDLLILPLSYVALNVLVFVALAGAADWLHLASLIWLWIGSTCGIALIIHVLRGWQLSRTGVQGLLDLARVPGFLAWRLWLTLRRRASKEWVRTTRESDPTQRLK
jgi:cellulose synthase/poly-beta-1,6-N-acetylglucosamine synthase-like glycosyltransferase